MGRDDSLPLFFQRTERREVRGFLCLLFGKAKAETMALFDELETREIKPLENAAPEDILASEKEQQEKLAQAEPQVFPEEKVQEVNELKELEEVGSELNSGKLLEQLPEIPEQTMGDSVAHAYRNSSEGVSALQQLAENQSATGSSMAYSRASEHIFPDAVQKVNDNDQQRVVSQRQPYDTAVKPEPETDQQALNYQAASIPCADNMQLLAKKLQPFRQLLYLNPAIWESDTLLYIFKAYKAGISVKGIHEKVSSPARFFADAAGKKIPTFRGMRAQIGNLRMIDVYGLLATSIFLTATKNGKVQCLGERGAMRVLDGISLRPMPPGTDGAEIPVTTFVDLIYYDYLYPNKLGHGGLMKWMKDYCDISLSMANARKIYDSILQPFRLRRKNSSVEGITPPATASLGARFLKKFDTQLANHGVVLRAGKRQFFLLEFPDDLPKSLPKTVERYAKQPVLDLKLFLRKFLDSFDASLPFDQHMIQAVQASMMPVGEHLPVPVTDSGTDPFAT